MKKVMLVAVFAFAGMIAKAQEGDGAWAGQGTKVVNLGYGVGSIWKTLFKLSAGFTNSKTTAVGPYAVGFEYGVSEKIGVGVQLGYGSVKNVSTDPGANSNGGDLITTEELKSLQIFARGNYHFGQSEKFDPYLGLGLGYGNFKLNSSDNDANYSFNSAVSIPSAFIYSGALGAKYYFTSNIGLYAEIGYVTGSYFQGGIAIKF
ncbi:MAG: outer membrane beta-barrel protein [Bacteroidetes bacterium]|nr:outer membrane beta-barrel protein [Bacteroidota bacterium]